MMAGFAVSRQFWSASESWYARHSEGQRKAKGYGISPSAGKEARWKSKGAKYMISRKPVPNTMIRVDPKLMELVIEPIEAVVPALSNAYDKHLGGLARLAFRDWPVYTGLSKSLLALEYSQPTTSTFQGSVVSRAPYTYYIGTKGKKIQMKQPHRQLIDKPSRAVVDAIGRDTIDVLGRKG